MKWVKLAAVIGFIFTGILFLSLILSFVNSNYLLFGGDRALGIIIEVIYLIASLLFLFGFVKVGQHTGHKLLRVSSWMLIASIFVGVLFMLIFGLTNLGSSDMQGANSIDQATIDEMNALFNEQNADPGFNYNGNSVLTGNAIGNFFSGETIFGLVLGILFLIFFLNSNKK